MTKLFWTVIILAPIMLAGIMTTIGIGETGALGAFNASGAVSKWKEVFGEIKIGVDGNEEFNWLSLIWYIAVAVFLTMPFIFVWKGTKIVGWIPLLGFWLRVAVVAILILLPNWEWFWNVFLSADEVDQMQGIFEIIIIGLALWGVWFVR